VVGRNSTLVLANTGPVHFSEALHRQCTMN